MKRLVLPILLGLAAAVGSAQNLVTNGDFEMEGVHWKLTQWTGTGFFGTLIVDVKPGVLDRALGVSFSDTSGTQAIRYESLPFAVPGGWQNYPIGFRCMWRRASGNSRIQGINYILVSVLDANTRATVRFWKNFVPNLGGTDDRLVVQDQVRFPSAGLYMVEVEVVHTWHASGGFPYSAYVDDISIADGTLLPKGSPCFGASTINSTGWVMGQPVTITGHNATPYQWGAIWLSFRGASPLRPLPGCEIWVDPTRLVTVVPVITDGKGRWTFRGWTPSLPLLSGEWFAFQAAFYPLSRWPGFEATPGLFAMVTP